MRFWITMVVLLFVDQISKWAVRSLMVPGKSISVLPGFLSLTYVQNRGAAFGIFQGQTVFLLVCAAVVVGAVIYINKTTRLPGIMQIITGLVAGGALGNLLDRFIRGYVIDFIDLGWWPVFNVADSAICCAVVATLIYTFREEKGEIQDG